MRLLITAVLAGILVVIAVVPATAAPAAKTYPNCAAIHRDDAGGIAKAGVRWNTVSGQHRALKGKVKSSTELYKANTKSDRDRDGIACELS